MVVLLVASTVASKVGWKAALLAVDWVAPTENCLAVRMVATKAVWMADDSAAQRAGRKVERRAAPMVVWKDSRSVERKAASKAAHWESQKVACWADCLVATSVAWLALR